MLFNKIIKITNKFIIELFHKFWFDNVNTNFQYKSLVLPFFYFKLLLY